MKGLENPDYLVMYLVSNIVGLLILWAAFKKPKIARFVFFLLFAWASWINYTLAHTNPEAYLEYATMSAKWYGDFINGWFKENITLMVTAIAIGQGLISVGMLLRGLFVKLACIGTIIFLLAIAPLGVGAAFPFSITVGLAAFVILRKDNLDYIWKISWPKMPPEIKSA